MLVKYANNGELLPRFYGVAWFDWLTNRAVCLPLGINVLAALARSVYFSIKHAGRIVMANPRDAYAQGLRDGLAEFDRRRAGVEPTRPWPRA
jgi:uncharacterized membrane protein